MVILFRILHICVVKLQTGWSNSEAAVYCQNAEEKKKKIYPKIQQRNKVSIINFSFAWIWWRQILAFVGFIAEIPAYFGIIISNRSKPMFVDCISIKITFCNKFYTFFLTKLSHSRDSKVLNSFAKPSNFHFHFLYI